MKRIMTISFLLLFAGMAEAAILDYCYATREFFLRSFGKGGEPQIAEEDIPIWMATFAPEGEFEITPELNQPVRFGEPPIILWWMYERLPMAIRNYLGSLSSNDEMLTRHFEKIYVKTINSKGGYLNSFLHSLADHWSYFNRAQSFAKSPRLVSFNEWLNEGVAQLRKERAKNRYLDNELKQILDFSLRKRNIFRYWQNFYVVEIPVVGLETVNASMTISGHRFSVYRKENLLIVKKVPRNLVRHPKWNPMVKETIQYLATNGFNEPSTYPGVVGLDGFFYLVDGNHRFELGGSSVVDIRLSYPVTTVSLSNHLDLVGVPSPDFIKLRDFYDKKIALDVLIPEPFKKQLIFSIP